VARDDHLENARRGGDKQGGQSCIDAQLDARDGLVGLVYDALLGTEVVDEIAADDGDGAVGEPDGDLSEVIGGCEGRYLGRPVSA
jgi:hypothetical protein